MNPAPLLLRPWRKKGIFFHLLPKRKWGWVKRHLFALAIIVVFCVTAYPTASHAVYGDVRTWMSKSYAGDGGDARQAWLDNPGGFDADNNCNLYVADTINNVIRRIDGTTNKIITYAGNGHYGITDGLVSRSSFSAPEEVVLNGSELYVADTGNGRIRVVKNGVVSTWLTGLRKPLGLLFQGSTLYISEANAHRITAVDRLTSVKTTFANISGPSKMVKLGNDVYVIHNAYTALSRIDMATGVITSIKTDFINAEGLAVSGGTVYVVAGDNGITNEIWTFTPGDSAMTIIASVPETEMYNHQSDITFCNGVIRLLFRAGSSIYTDDDAEDVDRIAGIHRWGDLDGLRSVALVGRPSSMVLSKDKTKFYLLENQKVKVFDLITKTLSFLAGHANDNYTDGIGGAARVSGPTQMVLSKPGGRLFIADRNNNRIRVLDIATGAMTTLTGAGRFNMFNNQNNSYAEGSPCPGEFNSGVAGCAYFNRPMGIALSLDGSTLYVADSSNSRIRTVNTKTGKTALLAGGSKGFVDGVGSAAKFSRPSNLLLSKDGKRLYVVDLGNHAIREITLATKSVKKIIGKGQPGYRNGSWASSYLSYPDSLAHGPGNTMFLSEVGSQRIRKIDLTAKTVGLLAGSGRRGMRNSTAALSSFNNPKGMLMIGSTLLVADSLNDLIRSVSLK